jgi:general secretion pathway protein A
MVLNYYKLAEQPFGVTPDPRFLYLSATHREAMASVFYGVKAGRGFSALVAEPGMGKTTVLFNLLQQLGTSAKTAFLFQAQDTPINFLRNLLADLGVEEDGSDLVRMQVTLNECLVRETSQGKHFVVVVDEAQNLDEPVLEVVRMLSNFETPHEKLMHIILAGQPQLATKLALPQLKQLRQRISIIARLSPFNASETKSYIEHRLAVAGYAGEAPLFTDRAFSLIAQYSGGIPRNINNICFNAMSLGCAIKRKSIHAEVIEEVLSDLDLKPLSEPAVVSEYRAPVRRALQNQNVVSRVASRITGGLTGLLPKRWAVRAGLAAAVALLAGIGFTAVVAKNRRAEVEPAATMPGSSATDNIAQSVTLPSANAATTAVATPSSAHATTDANVANAPAGSTALPDPAANAAPVDTQDSILVTIEEDSTLYKICVAEFGKYDPQIVHRILELNPGMTDPRKLHIGQQLRIPTARSILAKQTVSANSLGATSAVEAKRNE